MEICKKQKKMSTTTAQAGNKPQGPGRQPRRVSKEQFLREFSKREDGYKYEWNDGVVEKTKAMNQQQLFIQNSLLRCFLNTQVFKDGGLLTSEGDMGTLGRQLRRPDLAIYTAKQVGRMRSGENQVAPWVAEVISPTDKADDINKKLEEYFQAGVQVVWHIFPHSRKVDVYTSPDNVTICRGATVCSGEPALAGFEITAAELFA